MIRGPSIRCAERWRGGASAARRVALLVALLVVPTLASASAGDPPPPRSPDDVSDVIDLIERADASRDRALSWLASQQRGGKRSFGLVLARFRGAMGDAEVAVLRGRESTGAGPVALIGRAVRWEGAYQHTRSTTALGPSRS